LGSKNSKKFKTRLFLIGNLRKFSVVKTKYKNIYKFYTFAEITQFSQNDKEIEKVVNFEYSNFKNLTSKKCLKRGELSSPLSAYSYC
jgi:hypothetical protein